MAITKDITKRAIIVREARSDTFELMTHIPGNVVMIIGSHRNKEPVLLNNEYASKKLHHNDSIDGIFNVMEAIELRICAWPKPGDSDLLQKRNMSAMATLDLTYRRYSL